MAGHRHFRLIIAGNNPEELIKKYDNKLPVEKYCVVKFADAEKIYNQQLNYLNELLKVIPKDDPKYGMVEEEISYFRDMDYLEYYSDITDGLEIDKETGDAYSMKNPNGKFDNAQIGGRFALPFITKDGKETYTAKKDDVAWDKVHMTNAEAYEVAWDCVMGNRKPVTDDEKTIYENMKNRKVYFEHYKTRENYISSNTAFWGFAFLSEETGWVELEPNVDQYKWVNKFYERFIVPLDNNEILSIYECIRNSEEN